MSKFTLTIATAVFLLMSGAADLYAMEPLDDIRFQQSTTKNALPTISPIVSNDLLDEMNTLIVRNAALEQCLDNELPVNIALVCTEWFKFIEGEMQEGKPCFKAWYGIFGHEDIYQTFLKGVLLYRPIPDSNVGMITLKISEFKENSSKETSRKLPKKNPLEGTFDLSTCGDMGQYLSISTGYRKGKKQEIKDKTEIWIAPHFMIEKKIANAPHLKNMMWNWDGREAPVGVLFTRPHHPNEYFDYCTSKSLNYISENNLYNIWGESVNEWAVVNAAKRRCFMFHF